MPIPTGAGGTVWAGGGVAVGGRRCPLAGSRATTASAWQWVGAGMDSSRTRR